MRIRHKNCVLVAAALLVSAGGAMASPFTVTTTGIITSATDRANLFGAGAGLIGSSYVLSVAYSGVGPGYYTDGGGQAASDYGDPITGSIRLTIGGTTISTALLNYTGATLSENPSELYATNTGNDAAGNFAYAVQAFGAAGPVIPFADLQNSFSYLLTAADTGTDTYSFSNADNSQTASFGGTESSITFAVPEPATWSLLGLGLIGLAFTSRRRVVRTLAGCAVSAGAMAFATPASATTPACNPLSYGAIGNGNDGQHRRAADRHQ